MGVTWKGLLAWLRESREAAQREGHTDQDAEDEQKSAR